MDADFWHAKWHSNQIGFYQTAGNPLLQKHLAALGLTKGARIFLPLCGKTGDIAWLLSQGFQVAGAELSPLAIDQLFEDLGLTPTRTAYGDLTKVSATGLDIFVGDIFDLTLPMLAEVDAVYDRAAYVALPEDIRPKYAQHMQGITAKAPQLLITFDYDPSTVSGPPHAITATELQATYGANYTIKTLEVTHPKGGIKGVIPATETISLLT